MGRFSMQVFLFQIWNIRCTLTVIQRGPISIKCTLHDRKMLRRYTKGAGEHDTLSTILGRNCQGKRPLRKLRLEESRNVKAVHEEATYEFVGRV
jgi:hypothetical protein